MSDIFIYVSINTKTRNLCLINVIKIKHQPVLIFVQNNSFNLIQTFHLFYANPLLFSETTTHSNGILFAFVVIDSTNISLLPNSITCSSYNP